MKPKEQIKPVEHKPNNRLRAAIVFNNLINERKKVIDELHDSDDYDNLNFKYADPKNKDVSFHEFLDSKNFFNKLKNNKISFDNAQKKHKPFLNKLNNAKIGGKNDEQKKVINNIKIFLKSREEVFNFFKDYTRIYIDPNYEAKQDQIKGTGLKILTPKQMLQRLPIALAQVRAGNNSKNLLNEIQTNFLFFVSIKRNH